MKRVIRALEVLALTGRPMSRVATVDGDAEIQYTVSVFGICMQRALLYQRIDMRVDAMMAAGLLQEVAGLLRDGYGRRLQSMQALGYRQFAVHLAGEMSLSETASTVKRETRRFAKRQLTWFRRDGRVRWIDVSDYDDPRVAADVVAAAWRADTPVGDGAHPPAQR